MVLERPSQNEAVSRYTKKEGQTDMGVQLYLLCGVKN